MPRQILDIFLSSTSEDLREYRRTVGDVLGRLGQFAVRMESFGAKPTKPLDTCRDEVQACDALIVVVGHRYGWIPPKTDGGDDERSITYWEVQWALDAGMPVYAFLVDPSAAWTGPREQDRLAVADTESAGLDVWRAVRHLRRFREFLETRTTRELFATPDQLGSLVATSLFPWLLKQASPVRASGRAGEVPMQLIPADATPEQVVEVTTAVPDQTYWHEQVHAVSARERISKPHPVKVGIVAGQPRTSHPALKNVSVLSISAKTTTEAGEGDDYTTAIAALIASPAASGFAGAAPGTNLLTISVLDDDGGASNFSIASAIDRSVVGGARVICVPLASPEWDGLITEAIRDAVDAGVTVVSSAGNSGTSDFYFPAALEAVISVGAVDARGELATWSSQGDWVAIAAPGDDLMVPAREHGYSISKGTSWSCAIVTGIVALVLQANPNLKPAEIKQLLMETAHHPPKDGGRSVPRVVNASLAVQKALAMRG